MSLSDLSPAAPAVEQAYLLEPDAGVLCRVLGLYVARGVDVLHADYGCAGQGDGAMRLRVRVTPPGGPDDAVLRVLVDKAATLVGVLAAC